MSDNTEAHRPITPDGWELVFGVIEGTKLDVPRIRAEVARLQALAQQAATPAPAEPDPLTTEAGAALRLAVRVSPAVRLLAAPATPAAPPAAQAEPPQAWSQLQHALARHTIQELLSIYDECNGDWCKIARHVEDGVLAKLAAAPTPAAQAGDAWISVEDRLPEKGRHVIAAFEMDGPGDWRIKVASYEPDTCATWQGWRVFGGSWVPTHWQPLPAAPRAAQGQPEGGAA